MVLGLLALPGAVLAQEQTRSVLEVTGGYAGFVDDATIEHVTIGTAWRWNVGPRFSLGPEIVYMRGPGGDRDVFVTGKVLIDFLPSRSVSPYFVADGGLMLHRDSFAFSSAYWSNEGAVSFGGGARVDVTPRMFIAPEVRIGWEPHVRVSVNVGWRM